MEKEKEGRKEVAIERFNRLRGVVCNQIRREAACFCKKVSCHARAKPYLQYHCPRQSYRLRVGFPWQYVTFSVSPWEIRRGMGSVGQSQMRRKWEHTHGSTGAREQPRRPPRSKAKGSGKRFPLSSWLAGATDNKQNPRAIFCRYQRPKGRTEEGKKEMGWEGKAV